MAWAPVAPAQTAPELAELSLSTLLNMEVTGASRVATLRSESAASVTVITRDEIRALGYRSLGEALRSVRGAVVASDRTYDYLGVRGFFVAGDYNTRVLLLVDGNRTNDSLYDQAYLGSEFLLEIDEIERIEFIPGQGSALYGANALFGVVNVVTRAAAGPAGGQVGGGIGRGHERWWRANLQHSGELGSWRFGASRLQRDGEALADVQGASPQRVPGLERETRDLVHARWDGRGFSARLLHADRRKGVPFGIGLIFGDPANQYRDTFTLLGLQYEAVLAPTEQLTLRAHVGRYRFVGDYAVDNPPPTLNRDIGVGRWGGVEARLTSTRFAGHRLVGGFELQRASELTQLNFDVTPGTDRYLDDHRRNARGALFGEDQWQFAERWTLHLGARLDRVQGGDGATSPRVALAWRPADAWRLKAIHGRAFRAPNAYEAYYAVDTVAGYQRNPDLKPERVRGDEVSAEWLPDPAWRLSGALYRNRASGLLMLNYDASIDRFRFDNGSDFAARGAELELEHAVGGLRWRINASANRSRSGPTVDAAQRSVPTELQPTFPSRMLKGTLILPLQADWQLGAEARAISRRGAAPGYAVVNLALGGPLPLRTSQRPMLQLAIRNLFDRQAFDPGVDAESQPTLPQPRRSWRLTLDWPFGS